MENATSRFKAAQTLKNNRTIHRAAPRLLQLLMLLLPLSTMPMRSADLDALRLEAWGESTREDLSRTTFEKARTLFERTLSNPEDISGLRKDWAVLGMDLLEAGSPEEQFLVVKEQNETRSGRGFFVIRKNARHAHLWEAPHSRSDRFTGDIVMKLFLENQAQAGAWNTTARKRADLAHLEESFFQAFTDAFASKFPNGLIVQVHGFEAEKRTTPQGRRGGLIVSDGTKDPGPHAIRFHQQLSSRITEPVSLYPRQVTELGATTNAQGRALRNAGHTGFLHIEIDLATRISFSKHRTLRAALLEAAADSYP
jgi:hypothetical protein